MSQAVTLDASVLVSAFTPSENAHLPCKALLREVRQSKAAIILPTLVIVEIAAAIGRGQGKPDLGYAFALEMTRFPNLALVTLDESLARAAAEIAARHRLRGSDAVYVAVARRFGATLVTLDGEQHACAAALVPVQRPE